MYLHAQTILMFTVREHILGCPSQNNPHVTVSTQKPYLLIVIILLVHTQDGFKVCFQC